MYRFSSWAAVTLLIQAGCAPFGSLAGDAGTDSTTAPAISKIADSAAEAQDPADDGQDTANEGLPADVADNRVEVREDVADDDAKDAVDRDSSPLSDGVDSATDTAGGQLPTAGLLVHLEADEGLVVANGKVSKWTDQSGNGFDAVERELMFQPLYLPDANAGFAAVRFAPADSGPDLTLPDGFANIQSGFSMFFVLRVGSSDQGAVSPLFMDPNGPTLILEPDNANGVLTMTYGTVPPGTSQGSVSGYLPDVWHLIEVIHQGGMIGSRAAFTAYLDGSAFLSSDEAVPAADIRTPALGYVFGDATLDLQAVALFGRAVTNDERRKIEQILGSKWDTAH
jgi:hypothetical protein